VRPHPHLVDLNPHARSGQLVAVHPQHVDGVVGERGEVGGWQPERDSEDLRQLACHPACLGEPRLDCRPETREDRPEIVRVDLLVEPEAGPVAGLRADVERLEQVRRRDHAQAVAEVLGARTAVATVDARQCRA